MSAALHQQAVAAVVAATGLRYCTHGQHEMPAADGQMIKSGRVTRWICNGCLAKKRGGK